MISDRDLVLKLFDDFAIYREQTAFVFNLRENIGAKKTMPKVTEEKLAKLQEMVVWCREQRLEPRQWLFSLFAGRGWKYPVKLETGHLCSKNMIEKYKRQRGLGFFVKRLQASRDDAVEADPNRDLLPSVEARKIGYQQTGQHVRCREETMLNTLGYHPKSPTCVRCPEKKACALSLMGRMPFDIIALRDGRLSADDAERFARDGEKR